MKSHKVERVGGMRNFIQVLFLISCSDYSHANLDDDTTVALGMLESSEHAHVDDKTAEFLLELGSNATAAELDEAPSEAVLEIRYNSKADLNGQIIRIFSRAFDSVAEQRILVVIIEGHDIQSIDAGAFDRIGRGSVNSLSLVNNRLSSLPVRIFSKLSSLTHLDLSRNMLDAEILRAGALRAIASCKTITLAQNSHLSSLPAGALSDMPKLRLITVTACPITSVSHRVLNADNTLAEPHAWSAVNITSSNILGACTVVPAAGVSCTSCTDRKFDLSISSVDISCIKMANAPSNAKSATSRKVHFGAPAAEIGVYDIFPQEHTAIIPHFGKRDAQAVGPTLGRLRSRRAVGIIAPPVMQITSGTFLGLASQAVNILIIEGHSITDIAPGAFANVGTSELTELVLYNNNLTVLLDGTFVGLDSLNGLDIGGNPLTSLTPGVFYGLDSLRFLGLSYMSGLTSLNDNVFMHMPTLTSMNLRFTLLMRMATNVMGPRDASYTVTIDGSSNLADCSTNSTPGIFQMLCSTCKCDGYFPYRDATSSRCVDTRAPSMPPSTSAPTRSPTRNPTTRSPTTNPTTRSPTVSPSVGTTTTTSEPLIPICSLEGWSFKYGNSAVCGRSRARGGCHKANATYDDAVAICQAENGRLCDVLELNANVAKGTGCSLDNRTVWTRSICGSGRVFKAKGSLQDYEPVCTDTDARILQSVRCCQDASSTL